MLATSVGVTTAIFSAHDIGNLGFITLIVTTVIVLVPIGIGVLVGMLVHFLYRTIRKKKSGNGNQAIGDDPNRE